MQNAPEHLDQGLKQDFWGTLYRWQNHRPVWLLAAFVALASELAAIGYFQGFLNLAPCEVCVYIRLSMAVIFFGAVLAAVYPRHILFKTVGYLLMGWSVIRGLLWSIDLNATIQAVASGHSSTCSATLLAFPFGLPLDTWFPSIFMPMALCGEDTWRLLGFNMAQYTILIYAVYLLLMLLGLLALGIQLVKGTKHTE